MGISQDSGDDGSGPVFRPVGGATSSGLTVAVAWPLAGHLRGDRQDGAVGGAGAEALGTAGSCAAFAGGEPAEGAAGFVSGACAVAAALEGVGVDADGPAGESSGADEY